MATSIPLLPDAPALVREQAARRFCRAFAVHREAFLRHLHGIADPAERDGYGTVLLHRLMFVYFLQRRRLLDGDAHALRTHMARCRQLSGQGEGRSFYRTVLRRLFGGAGGAAAGSDVPWLGGARFAPHPAEVRYPDLDVPDDAFEALFDFFDRWEWTLGADGASGRAVTPDVLGDLFEQYVDRKPVGAYYTKEDVAGYITRNTLLPFVLDEARRRCPAAFEGERSVWRYLQRDPDAYLYASLRHTGRYDGLRRKLAGGEVRSTADLVALNLDVERFVRDVVVRCETPALLRALWAALCGVSVLDPTCGSGAFLLAALGQLERLYTACLDRMQAFLDASGDPGPLSDFAGVLGEAHDTRYHAHPSCFVRRRILLDNLYGVDVVPEAVEGCKLRLWLTLAAGAVGRLGALPDLDANVRAGNALVGYVRPGHGEPSLGPPLDGGRRQGRPGGGADPAAKRRAHDRADLSGRLDRALAAACGVAPGDEAAFAAWRHRHQPLHWFAAFDGVMDRGGFDVVVGNPPYAAVPRSLDRALLRRSFASALDRWSRDENLYTFAVERGLEVLKRGIGAFGMVLPLSLACSTRAPFAALRRVVAREAGHAFFSHFDRIPSALFGNDVRTRCTIALVLRAAEAGRLHAATTPLLRWSTGYRPHLLRTVGYVGLDVDVSDGIPKVGSRLQAEVLRALLERGGRLGDDLKHPVAFTSLAASAPHFPQPAVFVGGTAYNWFPAWRQVPPTTTAEGRPSLPARTAGYRFADPREADLVFALLCSSMGYWWWAVASDGFNLKKWLVHGFPLSLAMIPAAARAPLARRGAALRRALGRQYVYKDNRGRIGNYLLPACQAEVLAIDDLLASSVPPLTHAFFADIRAFNAAFSRAGADPGAPDAEG